MNVLGPNRAVAPLGRICIGLYEFCGVRLFLYGFTWLCIALHWFRISMASDKCAVLAGHGLIFVHGSKYLGELSTIRFELFEPLATVVHRS